MRKPGWVRELARYLIAHESTPFEYGTHDCCTFAAGAADVMTGSHWLEHMEKFYCDGESARALIAKHGSLEVTVTALCGHASVPAEWAITGDWVLIDGPYGHTVGIVFADHILIAAQPKGYAMMPKSAAIVSWGVR